MSRSNGRPRRVEDWFRLVPNLLDDAGWDFKVYEPQTNLSHAACPWGGRLVKVILSKFEVRHPPEQMNCMLVRPELFGTGPSVLAPGEVVLRRPRRAWGINDTSVLFEEMAGSCECRMSPLRLEPMVTHQRFRRDYPSEGDSAYAVFNEGDDPQEGMLLCCWRGPGASGVLVDVVKIFCIPEETFCCWSDLHFQLILDSMRRACHLMLNGPACGELRVMDERLYIVLTIQSCKRGLPLYPLKEGSKQDPTVVISAGQHLQLQRWRRFQTNPVTGEKFRLSKYLAQFLANLEKDLAVYAKAVAYDLEAQADQLLVTEVPLRLVEPAASPIGCPTSSDTRLLPVDEGSKWKSFQLDMTPGDHSSTLCSAATCCHVSYRSRRQGEGYVLAVLNGLDISPEVAPWAAEACAVLPCQSSSDCLTYPSEALRQHSAKWFGEFESLEMEANFSTTQEVFPQVLATSQRLLSPRAWHLHRGARSGAETTLRLALNGSAVEELVSLQLYGRPYWRDSDIQQHCHCGPKVEGVLV